MTRKERRTEKLVNARNELKLVDAAITAILGGAQSYSIGTRSLSRANLSELYKRKKELEDLIDALTGGSGRFKRVVPIG